MNVSSLQEIKEELQELSSKDILELCLSLAKYRKDNKEYLGYLLFRAHDRNAFIVLIKTEIDGHFKEMEAQKNLYHLKKSLRKLLRILTRYCKYMGDKGAAAEVLIYFCLKIKQAGIPIHKDPRLFNLFNSQEKKIGFLISTLEEDLRTDFLNELAIVKSFTI